MTTFDKDGRVTSTFQPPTDEHGRVLDHRSWLERTVVDRFEAGEAREDIEDQLAKSLGQSIIWHGESAHYAESVRIAIGALRRAAGFPNTPTLRTTQPEEPT